MPYISVMFIFSVSFHFIAHIICFLSESESDLKKPSKQKRGIVFSDLERTTTTPWGAFCELEKGIPSGQMQPHTGVQA